jgi:CRISPR-associated protein Csd2
MNTPIQNRYDFVYLFDVTDGNPNGDPDLGNMPRIDTETGQGLVTDVCLKRKIRNYVGLVHGEQPPYEIYIKEKAVLNSQHQRAYDKLGIKSEAKKLPKDDAKAAELTAWMCANFYDIRTFGAVMTTDVNTGQVRGPIQLTTSRSVSPIVSMEHAITRCAVTNKKDEEKERTIGRKYAVPYGLYMGFGYINATLAQQTKFGEDDLELFKQSLGQMFEGDRSAARGRMSPVRCVAFRHENKLGNARAHELFTRVKVALKQQLVDDKRPPRSKDDYVITVDQSDRPSGIEIEEWV